MFGIPSSYKIISKINRYFVRDKRNNSKYRIIMAPPNTLLENFSKNSKKNKIEICAQNCFEKNKYGAHTGFISPYMIKKIGIRHVIIGHSENRSYGESDTIIKQKVFYALKNNLTIIFCIGENKQEKKLKKTISVLKRQLSSALIKKYNYKKIIFAYEPVWSIGSGIVPSTKELSHIIIKIKSFIKNKYKLKFNPKILYGGSVDKKTITDFKSIKELDGFLIGGASKSSKNFIDIIKNFYK